MVSPRPLELRDVTTDGTAMTSRLDLVRAVHVQAERRKPPTHLAVQVVLLEVQSRGVSLSLFEAEEIARRVLAAEEIPTFGVDGR